jgi:hypothetical protein
VLLVHSLLAADLNCLSRSKVGGFALKRGLREHVDSEEWLRQLENYWQLRKQGDLALDEDARSTQLA